MNDLIVKERLVHSDFLNKDVTIIDNCGCKEGGFYEKEFTQHGFNGIIASEWVIIFCDQCNKPLSNKIYKPII